MVLDLIRSYLSIDLFLVALIIRVSSSKFGFSEAVGWFVEICSGLRPGFFEGQFLRSGSFVRSTKAGVSKSNAPKILPHKVPEPPRKHPSIVPKTSRNPEQGRKGDFRRDCRRDVLKGSLNGQTWVTTRLERLAPVPRFLVKQLLAAYIMQADC